MWPNLQLMKVPLSKWHHLVVKFATNASGAMLPNLVQVTELISGSVRPQAMFWTLLMSRQPWKILLLLNATKGKHVQRVKLTRTWFKLKLGVLLTSSTYLQI